MKNRAGFTVIETLTALLLLLLVVDAAWSVSVATARSAGALADRAESLAAARAVGWILQEELDGVGGADLTVPAGDSFSVRAFRGSAVVCARPAPEQLVVRWTGLRAPDPTKDSVLSLSVGGGWSARSLTDRRSTTESCGSPGDGSVERWTLSAPASDAALLRFFERGTYQLSDEALRYRIGGGGRQPLTPAALDPARSGVAAAPGRVVVHVATVGTRRGRDGPAWTRVFRLGGAP